MGRQFDSSRQDDVAQKMQNHRICTSDEAGAAIAERLDQGDKSAASNLFDECQKIRATISKSKSQEVADTREKFIEERANGDEEKTRTALWDAFMAEVNVSEQEGRALLKQIDNKDVKDRGCDIEVGEYSSNFRTSTLTCKPKD